MRKCPVCDTENANLKCRVCGFDGSCDYEQLPTLSRLSRKTDSLSRKRADFHTGVKKLTRGKRESWTLRLGMVCIPLHAVSFSVTLHAPEIVLILIAIQLLMQYRLWKKGFSCSAFLKQIWKFPVRFDPTQPIPPTTSVIKKISKIIFDSFAYALTSLIIRVPAYIIVVLGYLAIFTPMANLGNYGLLYKLFDIWLKFLFLYTALWVHGHIRAMRK